MNSLMTGWYKEPGGTSVFQQKLTACANNTSQKNKIFLIYRYEIFYFRVYSYRISVNALTIFDLEKGNRKKMVQMKVFAHILDQQYS